jgi:hypothetical protein
MENTVGKEETEEEEPETLSQTSNRKLRETYTATVTAAKDKKEV